MTGRKSQVREFCSVRDVGIELYGNNTTSEIKGDCVIKNGEFTIRNVHYVDGLQHNLISVSELVVSELDEEGLVTEHKETGNVLLKSKRKGDVYPLHMKHIERKPSI